MAKYAVHGVAGVAERVGLLGRWVRDVAKREFISRAEVNPLTPGVGIQFARFHIAWSSMKPFPEVRQPTFIIRRINSRSQAKLPHVTAAHCGPASLANPVNAEEHEARQGGDQGKDH